jgi:hypothetical protein
MEMWKRYKVRNVDLDEVRLVEVRDSKKSGLHVAIFFEDGAFDHCYFTDGMDDYWVI